MGLAVGGHKHADRGTLTWRSCPSSARDLQEQAVNNDTAQTEKGKTSLRKRKISDQASQQTLTVPNADLRSLGLCVCGALFF